MQQKSNNDSQSYKQFPNKDRMSTKLLIESKYSKLLSLRTQSTNITYFTHNYMRLKDAYYKIIQKDLRCHLPVIENQWKQTAHNKKRSYIVKKKSNEIKPFEFV